MNSRQVITELYDIKAELLNMVVAMKMRITHPNNTINDRKEYLMLKGWQDSISTMIKDQLHARYGND